MKKDSGEPMMCNESNQRGWIAHGVGRLEGEVAQFSGHVSNVERKLDRLEYAVLGLLGIGFIALAVMLLPLFGVRIGG